MPFIKLNRRLIPLVFSGILGVVGVYMMNLVMRNERQKLENERSRLYRDYKNPVQVIVAVRDLPEGATLAREDLGLMEIPEKFIQPYATQDPNQLIGKVTRSPIAEKEQVLVNKVRAPEERPRGTSLSDITPNGKRAVTIGLDPITGVGGFVRPGDKVDILWSFRLAQPAGASGVAPKEEPVTLTLFQDVQILAVNNQLLPRAASPGSPTPEGGGGGGGGEYTVTLALAPNEAALLLFAREQGRIQLSLRPPHDAGQQVAIQPANIDALMQMVLGIEQKPSKEAQVPPSRTVELYRGLERNVVTVEAK